jgi:hypothetical protein
MRGIVSLLIVTCALVAAANVSAAPDLVPPTTFRITVGTHGVVGGPKKFTVRKGKRVVLLVRSAIGKAVHLHGYDIERTIRSRTVPVRIAFVARLTGVFEIELHLTETRELSIGTLTVR